MYTDVIYAERFIRSLESVAGWREEKGGVRGGVRVHYMTKLY